MSDTPRTFEFLLNTMERASQAKSPFEAKYDYKRKAVFNYVEGLERELAEAQAGIECAQQVEQVLRERIAELEALLPESLEAIEENHTDHCPAWCGYRELRVKLRAAIDAARKASE